MFLVHSAPPQVITPRVDARTRESHPSRDPGDGWLMTGGWALITLALLAAAYFVFVIATSGTTPV